MSEARIIDCERHVNIPTLESLLPYITDPAWHHNWTTGEFEIPPIGPHPGVELEPAYISEATPADLVASLGPEIDIALLVAQQALQTAGWLSHATAETFVRATNDWIVNECLPLDPRLRFAIAVSPHDAALAATEIRRHASNPAAAAVALSLIAMNMGDKHYHPIYEAACEAALPIVVHPGGGEGQAVGPAALSGSGPRTPEEVFALLPQVASSNLGSLIFEGTFETFPGLRVVFAGWGFTWALPVSWRADSEWRGLRHEVPWVKKPPSTYIADHVRFVVDGSRETTTTAAWRIAEMLPPQLLLFGSDAPYVAQDADAVLADVPVPLRERIGVLNAQETFGVEPRAPFDDA